MQENDDSPSSEKEVAGAGTEKDSPTNPNGPRPDNEEDRVNILITMGT